MSAPFVVLVIEDSSDDARLFKHAFKQIGIDAQFATDGLEAIDYLTGVNSYADRTTYPFPNIILLDLKMPRMNGLEFLEWMRNNPGYRVIPSIVFSSSTLPSDIDRAYELGAHGYFKKPVAYADLAPLFKKIIDYWELAAVPAGSAQPVAAQSRQS